MSKEDGLPSNRFEIHGDLIDDMNSTFGKVYAELGIDPDSETGVEDYVEDPMKKLVVEMLDRIRAASLADPIQDRIRQEQADTAIIVLTKMGFAIDDYYPLLHSHGSAVVANKLIEAKRDAAG